MSEKRGKKRREVKHVEQPENLSMLFSSYTPGQRDEGTSYAPGINEKRLYRKINTHTHAHSAKIPKGAPEN